MVVFCPQRVKNGSLVNGMDKRKNKFFAGPDPGAKRNTPVTSVDDLKRGDERPEQKSGNPRADDYQACNPSTVHSLIVAK